MARADDLHIVPDPASGKWKLVRAGRTLASHRTQEGAERIGRVLARRNKVDLVTHGRDGRIRSKDSFGNESAVRDMEH